MNDSYQAVYDAARAGLDASHSIYLVQVAFQEAAWAMACPSVLYRPAISIDGNMWCALYGANLMEGVVGFGDSPAQAMADFDRNWNLKLSERAK